MLRFALALAAALSLGMPLAAADTAASEPPSPALPYAVAGLATLLILFTICKPSKKSFYED